MLGLFFSYSLSWTWWPPHRMLLLMVGRFWFYVKMSWKLMKQILMWFKKSYKKLWTWWRPHRMVGRLWTNGVNILGWKWGSEKIYWSEKAKTNCGKKLKNMSGHWHCCGRQTLVLHPQQTHWARWLSSPFMMSFICNSLQLAKVKDM